MTLPKRKPTRLKNYDYSTYGYYFVTICSANKKCIFSRIVGQGLGPAENKLSEYGKIATEELTNLEKRYPALKIDKYVVIPNRIHPIIAILNQPAGASPCPTLSDIICAFKSITTHKCHLLN